MPPPNLDAMIQDVSNNMASAQLLRRLSANSNSTTTSSKKGSMRIVKGNSGGTSPHNIQRRRTTASHTAKANHSMAQDNVYHRQGTKVDYKHRTQGTTPIVRPVSWHPSSREFETYTENTPASEPILRYTIAGIQGLAVTNNPTPEGVLPSAAHHGYVMNGSSTIYGQSNLGMDGCGIYDGDIYPSYPSYNLSDQIQYPNVPLPYPYGSYASEDFQQPDWSQLSSDFTTFIPPQTPDFLPIQYPLETSDAASFNHPPQINKKRSKELVGMGLYDSPDRDTLSKLEYNHASDLTPDRGSTGKGLKLEETWQPPKDLDDVEDDGEEEAYSTDEAEEDLPVAPLPAEVPTGFYPAYGDLSNQTFFFDNDDQYSSCIAFDQEIQICQPKGSDAASENFLWF